MSGKTLVTGAGGFIGSHLVEILVERGISVRAFVHYNSQGSWGWLEQSAIKDRIQVVLGDIRDYDAVEAAVEGCSEVFHLAALIGIPYSYVSPLAYVRTNVEGTYNVLQAARRAEVRQVLITSTSETYGTAQYIPIDELHPAVGQSPYAASKVGADQLALSFHRSFGLPVKVVRPFNSYGPRQSSRAIIPTIMTQLLAGRTELHLGSLEPTRDFTFVEDTARGILAISLSDATVGQATNISTGEEISVRDLVTVIGRVSGRECSMVADSERLRPANSEVERLLGSNAKIRTLTDWRAEETLETGLTKTWVWFERHHHLYKSGRYEV